MATSKENLIKDLKEKDLTGIEFGTKLNELMKNKLTKEEFISFVDGMKIDHLPELLWQIMNYNIKR